MCLISCHHGVTVTSSSSTVTPPAQTIMTRNHWGRVRGSRGGRDTVGPTLATSSHEIHADPVCWSLAHGSFGERVRCTGSPLG